MATISETSYWINFFTSGGIPAGDATHYAILFSDNRITRDMLLDLSKEYLTDMGISRLGDIIAILKHAKQVYNQEARDKVMKSTSLSTESFLQSSSFTSSPRRSTAASRMVNHFTSKHPEAAPMSQSPAPKPPPPDPPKSKRKVSVFERLGADDSQDSVTLPSGNNMSSPQNSVFSRLGGKAAMKRAASNTSFEDLDHLIESSKSLPYAGVLKNSPSPAKKANIKVAVNRSQIKMKKIVKIVNTEEEKASNIQRPEVSTTTEGVLSDFAKKDSLSLKDRLGRKSDTETPSSTSGAKMELPKFMVATSQRRKKATGVQNRLGARKEDSQSSSVVSSTQQRPIAKVKRRGMTSDALSKPSGGVFSRLGKKSS